MNKIIFYKSIDDYKPEMSVLVKEFFEILKDTFLTGLEMNTPILEKFTNEEFQIFTVAIFKDLICKAYLASDAPVVKDDEKKVIFLANLLWNIIDELSLNTEIDRDSISKLFLSWYNKLEKKSKSVK